MNITENVKEFYNKIAKKYASKYNDEIKRKYYKILLIEPLISFLKFKNKKVLDLGTGPGWFLFEVAKDIKQGVGIDISDEMIKIANFQNKYHNLIFEVMDAKKLNFSDESFDIITSFGMFEYIQDMSPFLKEIKRVLKKDGIFILTCRNKCFLFLFINKFINKFIKIKNKIIFVEHTKNEVSKLLIQNGFEVFHIRSTFFIPFIWEIYHIIPHFMRKTYILFLIYLNILLERIFPNRGATLVICAIKKKKRY